MNHPARVVGPIERELRAYPWQSEPAVARHRVEPTETRAILFAKLSYTANAIDWESDPTRKQMLREEYRRLESICKRRGYR